MKKMFLLLLVLISLVLGILIFWYLLPKTPAKAPAVVTSSGIEVFSPKENEIIASPLKITGVVNGSGWTGFEGQVGTVTLQDDKGAVLAQTFLPATTEWTTLPTNFETTIEFSAVSGAKGYLIFKNENASGDPVRDKTFTLPVTFK